MVVLPEIDEKQIRNSDLWKRVMGNKTSQSAANSSTAFRPPPAQPNPQPTIQPQTPSIPSVTPPPAARFQPPISINTYRQRFLAVIAIGALIGLLSWYFWDDIFNTHQTVPPAAFTNPTQDTTQTADSGNFAAFTDVATQNFQRNPTTLTVQRAIYTDYTIDITRRGLSYSAQIIEGYASTNPNVDFQQRTSQIDPNQSTFQIQARGLKNNIITQEPIVFFDEQGQVNTTDTGLTYGSLAIPFGTNSVVVLSQDGSILDQVYVADRPPEITLNSILSTYKPQDTLNFSATVIPAQPYTLDVDLLNTTSYETISLINRQPITSSDINIPIVLSQHDIPAGIKWQLYITVRSFFYISTVQSTPFILSQ